MPLRRATVAAAVALGTLGLLSGCGGGDRLDRKSSSGVVRVTLREYRIDPQDWQVPPGRVTLVATNHGRLTHNLAIESVTRQTDDQPKEFVRTKTVLPGQSVSATVTLRPGTYRIACTLANHDNLGQYGRLVVRAGS